MLKTIIIDDEPASRNLLEKMLQDYCPGVIVEATAENVAEGIAAIEKYKPDLVFLDIEMPDKTGFDLLASMDPIDFEVIIITGYEKYAIKAFKTVALDYLLKPIDVVELETAVKRVAEKRNKVQENKNFNVFVQNWKANGHEQIALASNDGFLFVKIKDIVYCKGDGSYTYFYLKGGERITVSKNLGEFD